MEDGVGSLLPSPLVGEGGTDNVRPDEGSPSAEADPSTRREFATLIRATLSHKGRGEGRTYTDAVVTPPSTTMVWPVMKVEASEPR